MGKFISRKRKNDIIYVLVSIAFFISTNIPRSIGLLIYGLMGRLAYYVPSREKTRLLGNLDFIYGEKWSEKELIKNAKKVYVHLMKNAFDAIYLTNCSDEKFFKCVKHNDLSNVHEEYKKGKGIVGITQHLGCFEINNHLFARMGMNCFSIGQELYDKRIDDLIVKIRERNNIQFLHRKNSGRKILSLLKKGNIFGVLVDYNTDLEGAFVNYMGKLALTPSAPMRIAMKYKIPVFAAYSARKEKDIHHLYVEGPFELEDTGDFERDLVINMEKVNTVLSKGVEENPLEWSWMLKRWNIKPGDPGYEGSPSIENYEL